MLNQFHSRFWPGLGVFILAFAASAQSPTSVGKSGNAFNPDTSVNILSLYQNTGGGGRPEDGFSLQEAEMQFASDIDPYWRASALFSVEKDGGKWGINPEEVYAETSSIPAVTVRVGKFKAAVGRHNALHTHAYPFLEAPRINTALLGDEGLNEAGISAAYLFPTDFFFSELTVQALKGENTELFNGPAPGDIATNIHWKNLLEHGDSVTSEIGFTGTFGRNSQNGASTLYGADYTLKFRPVEGGKYRSVVFSVEYLNGNRRNFAQLAKVDGLDSYLRYQFQERWSAGARFEVVGLAEKTGFDPIRKAAAIIGYDFSEFSALRLQYDRTAQTAVAAVQHLGLQLNISMGAHPAHAY